MQIKYPHKRIRSQFQAPLCSQIQLPLSRKKCEREPHPCEASVQKWQSLKAEGVSDKTCPEIKGISRDTFFRRQKALERLNLGLTLPSKRPKNLPQALGREAQVQQVMPLRRATPICALYIK